LSLLFTDSTETERAGQRRKTRFLWIKDAEIGPRQISRDLRVNFGNFRKFWENFPQRETGWSPWYIGPVRTIIGAMIASFLVVGAAAQKTVSFPTEDGGIVYADIYGEGPTAIVLAHGGPFNKESWKPQAQTLAAAGFRVLALDFRGYGKSMGPGSADPPSAPLHLDVLAAVRYLHAAGAKSVSVIGGSMGGAAAGDASIDSKPGEIDRIVFLGSAPNGPASQLKSSSLFIVARDDANDAGPRLPGIQAQYHKAPQPKELIVLDGSAHAQSLFQTDQGERVMREILRFLTAK